MFTFATSLIMYFILPTMKGIFSAKLTQFYGCWRHGEVS